MNDGKPTSRLTDRQNPLKLKAQIKSNQIKSNRRLRQNVLDDLKMTPW
jgi:hypothetical protein